MPTLKSTRRRKTVRRPRRRATRKRPQRRTSRPRTTNQEKLIITLGDGEWHATKELVHRVGHTFGCAKWRLVAQGFTIERRAHPSRRYQYQYRLIGMPEDF